VVAVAAEIHLVRAVPAVAAMVKTTQPHLRLELQTPAVVAVVVTTLVLQQAVKLAVPVSLLFLTLAHRNSVAVSSLLLVVTPFTHLQLLALFRLLHLCLHPIWLLQVVVVQ
jgi:hypothetical protein